MDYTVLTQAVSLLESREKIKLPIMYALCLLGILA